MSELSKCCQAKVVGSYYGDPSVPGGAMFFDVCSKCGEPHDNPEYEKWLARESATREAERLAEKGTDRTVAERLGTEG